jgi:hypothetical protein
VVVKGQNLFARLPDRLPRGSAVSDRTLRVSSVPDMVPRQFGGGPMGRRAAFQVESVQGALGGGENGGFYLIGRRVEMCNDTGKANGSEVVAGPRARTAWR